MANQKHIININGDTGAQTGELLGDYNSANGLLKLDSNGRKDPVHYDDLMGYFDTGIAGANQWLVQNIRDTLFPGKFLRNNSNDMFCLTIQSPHWRKQGVDLQGLHIHYMLNSAYTAGQTLVWDIKYTWLIPGNVVPASAGRTTLSSQSITLGASKAQYYYGLVALNANITQPSPDGYGTILLIQVTRGNGTYTGELAIFGADAHAQKDREGSINEFTD